MVTLAKQLGDGEFLKRQSAANQLVAFGEHALPIIRQAVVTSTSAELRYRARHVIRRIMLAASHSKSTGLRTAIIDTGTFSMGSPPKESGRKDDELPHRVRIIQPFLLGKYEVTQQQFRQVMEFSPSHFHSSADGRDKVRTHDTGQFPVERVSWFDAVAFCNRLSKMDGYAPYYKMGDLQYDGNSIQRAEVTVEGGNGYRLPTEAEWEYACRASSTGRFAFDLAGKKANFVFRGTVTYGTRGKDRSVGRTTKVGSYRPNLWGLYDMHGNVAEWCGDWYAKDYYTQSPPEDPVGPKLGQHRVLRGGSWLVSEANCRSASRFYLTGGQCKYFAGFRVARTP